MRLLGLRMPVNASTDEGGRSSTRCDWRGVGIKVGQQVPVGGITGGGVVVVSVVYRIESPRGPHRRSHQQVPADQPLYPRPRSHPCIAPAPSPIAAFTASPPRILNSSNRVGRKSSSRNDSSSSSSSSSVSRIRTRNGRNSSSSSSKPTPRWVGWTVTDQVRREGLVASVLVGG